METAIAYLMLICLGAFLLGAGLVVVYWAMVAAVSGLAWLVRRMQQ